jgi:hypothetical protein
MDGQIKQRSFIGAGEGAIEPAAPRDRWGWSSSWAIF